MKDNFAGRLSLFPNFFFFSFRTMNTTSHSLLDCKVSTKNSAASLMGLPSYLTSYFSFLFFFLWPCLKACRILFPWLGIEPSPTAVQAWSPNHWSTREVPTSYFSFAAFNILSLSLTFDYLMSLSVSPYRFILFDLLWAPGSRCLLLFPG